MKKIMFDDRFGLTQAVLEGRKTITRRTVSEKLMERAHDYMNSVHGTGADMHEYLLHHSTYKALEVAAVAQCYKDAHFHPSNIDCGPGWSNKMFVRADLMPHQIRITAVHIERLRDISDEDCLREGIWKDNEGGRVIGFPFGIPFYYTFDGAVRDGKQLHFTKPKEAFAVLIDKVSGKGTWVGNPFVYVYEFELVR